MGCVRSLIESAGGVGIRVARSLYARWRVLAPDQRALLESHAERLKGSALDLRGAGGGDSSASGGEAPIERGPGSGHAVVAMAYTRSSEQRVLAQIYAQALKHAGFQVRLVKGVGAGGPGVAAVERGRVSAYPRFA